MIIILLILRLTSIGAVDIPFQDLVEWVSG